MKAFEERPGTSAGNNVTDATGNGQTVVITGAAGYIGSLVVRRLLSCGYAVRIIDRLLYGDNAIRDVLTHPRLNLIVADFRDPVVVAQAIVGAHAVIHLGAIVGDPACAFNEQLTISTNFEASRLLASMCKKAGIERFVLASTCSVYGASNDVLDETSALNPISLYAQTKIAAEHAIHSMCDDHFAPVLLRFATAYGHSHRPRFDLVVNLLTAKAVVDGKITIYGGDQWRPFVHVDDIARAIVAALEAPVETVRGQIFNVGSNEQNHRLAEIGDIIQALVPNAEIVTSDLAGDKRNYYVTFDKIRNMLGFMPTYDLTSSVLTMKRAIERGDIGEYSDFRYNNYQFLRKIFTETPTRLAPLHVMRPLGDVNIAMMPALAAGD